MPVHQHLVPRTRVGHFVGRDLGNASWGQPGTGPPQLMVWDYLRHELSRASAGYLRILEHRKARGENEQEIWMSFVTFGRQRDHGKLHPAGRFPESGLRTELSTLTCLKDTACRELPNGKTPTRTMQSVILLHDARVEEKTLRFAGARRAWAMRVQPKLAPTGKPPKKRSAWRVSDIEFLGKNFSRLLLLW